MSEIGKGIIPKRLNLTRWSASEDACKSLRDSWHEVLQTSKSINDDCTEQPDATRSGGNTFEFEETGNGGYGSYVECFLERINKGEGEVNVYGGLERPEDGINIHGLFIDAGRWDMKTSLLVDPLPGQMNPPLPVIWFKPVLTLPKPDPRYEAPLYKTSERAGILSTTGHSTNFVLPVLLPTKQTQSYWIIRGTALLTQITD